MQQTSKLLSPYQIRGLELRNRICISPMCMYSAQEGLLDDYHLVHLGQFALGGAGTVFVEATAVEARGRITHGDSGIWADAHVRPLARIATFLKRYGAVPGIQLSHAGRKASTTLPWNRMRPLCREDAENGEPQWQTVSSRTTPIGPEWPESRALDRGDIRQVINAFADGASRALDAGFEIVEVHSAHGYLLHQFLSPLINDRTDAYGVDRAGRMRFPLEVVEAVRQVWPKDRPMFVRVSAVDGAEGGWDLDDTVVYAAELKARGVDVIDCSSGGVSGSIMGRVPRGLGFQVPYAEKIRREANIATMAVGLIVDFDQAESIIQNGEADLIAMAREALFNPHWSLHANRALSWNGSYRDAPMTYRWWLDQRDPLLRQLKSDGNVSQH